MHSNNFDISSYFKRINYTGPAAADTSTLHALMRHQIFSVPFENLDVQAGKIVSLAPDDIAEKVLKKGRGGDCYEVKGPFAMALGALGVPYRFLAGRPGFYPPRRPQKKMYFFLKKFPPPGQTEKKPSHPPFPPLPGKYLPPPRPHRQSFLTPGRHVRSRPHVLRGPPVLHRHCYQ